MIELLVNSVSIPMVAFLIVSLIMFFAGVFGFLTRKNLIMILISVELILNSVDINFAVFNRYLFPEQMEGLFFALFGIAIAACETAVAIAIIINIYRRFGNVDVDNVNKLKG
jgi:NADH-quinone oxidoreductase subunit K